MGPYDPLGYATRMVLTTVAAIALAPKWVSLFNGRNLDGWTPKIKGYDLGVNFGDTFRVENGTIKVGYDKYDGEFRERFGHLFYKKSFRNYKLRLEYRFTGEQCPGGPGWAWRNSGIMLHGQDPKTMRKDQDFPVSIEVQLLGGPKEGERHTGNVCTPGTNIYYLGVLHTQHCTDSDSDTYPGDRWVKAEVEVHGNGLILHRIEGKEVIRYEKAQLDPNDQYGAALLLGRKSPDLESGTVSLQSESHPCEFRKIEVMELAE